MLYIKLSNVIDALVRKDIKMKQWEKYRDEYYKNIDKFWKKFSEIGYCRGLNCNACPLANKNICLNICSQANSAETFKELLNKEIK